MPPPLFEAALPEMAQLLIVRLAWETAMPPPSPSGNEPATERPPDIVRPEIVTVLWLTVKIRKFDAAGSRATVSTLAPGPRIFMLLLSAGKAPSEFIVIVPVTVK